MSDDLDMTALLSRAADRMVFGEKGPPPVSHFVAQAHRRRVTRRVVAVAASAALVCLAVAVAVAAPARRNREVATGRATVFGVATGDVLVFDDGYGGVATVDLDNRTVSRQEIPGQRAGDQPWRLTVSGSDLIVGWGQVYAAPLAGGPSRLLGDATVSLPAAEPGRVWLVSYQGGRIGEGALVVRQVTTGGRSVIPPTTPNPGLGLGVPLVGIPGGLAFPTVRGLALWDAATGTITQTLGSPDPSEDFQAGLPSGDHLAWCQGACTLLHVTTLGPGGHDEVVQAPAGSSGFDAASARFSPDGRYLAVVAATSVVVVDTAGGAEQVVARDLSSQSSVAWGAGDSQVYFASAAAGGPSVTVGLADRGGGPARTATIPVDVQSTFVALPASQARTLVATTLRPAVECPTPDFQASGPGTPCGYRF